MSWEHFVEEGARLSAAAREAIAGSGGEISLAAAREALTALEIDARVVGIQDLADLAGALRRKLERGDAASLASDVYSLLEAAEAMVEAFALLSLPDKSGAHLDLEKLQRARRALGGDSMLPSAEQVGMTMRAAARQLPRSRTEAGQLRAPATPTDDAEDESAWTPTVDADMIDPFLEECSERLEGLAQKMVELERAPEDVELIRAIFRDLHTLKGSSAFVGLKKMTKVAHAAEDLVGLVRDGKRAMDRSITDALLAAIDVLGAIVQRASTRAPIDVDAGPAARQLRAAAAGVTLDPDQPLRAVTAAVPAPGAKASAARDGGGDAKSSTIRIDFEKLDLLMNLVGELVLAKGRLGGELGGLGSLARELDAQRRNAARAKARAESRVRTGAVLSQDVSTEIGRIQRAFEQLSQELDATSQRLDFVSGELRDQVMKLRMLPIGRIWSKYHRTVREIANRLGKQVRLELHGADTELDKVLVEQLDDPFLHLVRNAIDHGIEPPDEREAKEKEPEGVLRMAAMHRGNQIVIAVEDDGKGIDPERIRQKAVENGLVGAAQAEGMDRAELLDLIFRPGFSTAKQVSDMSGRGVGMDVVRETVQRLKGTVTVESETGRGTRFEIRLPLTLAIIQVLLVRCGGETYAIPIDLVARTVAAPRSAIRTAVDRETLLDAGRDIPVIRLRDVLGLPVVPGDERPEVPVVQVDVGSQSYGLVCDGFIGRQEIVIKSLGSLIAQIPGAAGATLLGDRCVLILDVPAIVSLALHAPRALAAPPVTGATVIGPVDGGGERRRVLVAEDSEVIRESIRRTLDAAGYDVTVAVDGQEALEIATREKFDLVSTDVVMPNLDGYELTRRLRQLPQYKDVPIVMVTSKGELIDQIRGFDAGVDAYLAKPTDAAELLRVIARHLAAQATKPPPEG